VKTLRWFVGSLIGVAGVAALCYWNPTFKTAHSSNTVALPSAKKSAVVKRADTAPSWRKNRSVEHPSGDYKKRLADAHDYWTFAHDVLPAAKAGNADAQYYLSKAMEYCADVNRFYFERRGQPVGLDQALQNAARLHQHSEFVQLAYDRCHKFFNEDTSALGTAADWLASATRAGQPLAESATASKLVAQGLLDNFAKAGAVPTSIPEPAKLRADPQELLYEAVQSREPEVLYNIGQLYPPMNPNDPDSNVVRYAWILLACERGLDCTANADWVKDGCLESDVACNSATSSSDYVRFLAGDQWPQVEQRARELGYQLDQGNWDKLGLGS
jgi:hypothetical protein